MLLIALATTIRRSAWQFNSAALCCVLPIVMLISWTLVVPIAWGAIGKVILSDDPLGRDFDMILAIGTPLLTDRRVYVAWACLLVALAVVLVRWGLRRRRVDLDDIGARLIVHPLLQWSLVLFFFVGGLLGIDLALGRPEAGEGTVRHVDLKIMTAVIVALPMVVTYMSPYLRSALDIVYDIVNHFYFRFEDADRARECGGMPTPFPVRRSIQDRLAASLRHFATQAAGPQGETDLILISHSQGTIFAVDTVNDAALSGAFDAFAGVRLVTMGSPLSHIYQHYFRQHYRLLDHPAWQALRERLGRAGNKTGWVNIYRSDDYVGRGIDESASGLIKNIHVPARGHIGYWYDSYVIRHLALELSLEAGLLAYAGRFEESG
jgi:hypothetical protein